MKTKGNESNERVMILERALEIAIRGVIEECPPETYCVGGDWEKEGTCEECWMKYFIDKAKAEAENGKGEDK